MKTTIIGSLISGVAIAIFALLCYKELNFPFSYVIIGSIIASLSFFGLSYVEKYIK